MLTYTAVVWVQLMEWSHRLYLPVFICSYFSFSLFLSSSPVSLHLSLPAPSVLPFSLSFCFYFSLFFMAIVSLIALQLFRVQRILQQGRVYTAATGLTKQKLSSHAQVPLIFKIQVWRSVHVHCCL